MGVKVIDVGTNEHSFSGANYIMVTNEGTLLVLDAATDSVENVVAAFAPGQWKSAQK